MSDIIRLSFWIAGLWTATAGASAVPPTADEVCANSTWSNCGVAVKQELDRGDVSPERAVQLAIAWNGAYVAALDDLRARHLLTKSKSDYELVEDAVLDKLNPVSIGKDAIKDALLKKYLPRLATVLEKAGPILGGLVAFFTPSQTASDLDELNLMSAGLIDKIDPILKPLMVEDGRTKYENAVKAAQPAFRRLP